MAKAKLIDAPIVTNNDGSFTVWAQWGGVDRPITSGVSTGTKRQLAERLRKAALAGKALPLEADIKTDTGGQTYASASWNVFGRRLNADLKRLGF